MKQETIKTPISVDWSFDVVNIPRGVWEKQKREVKDKIFEVDVFCTEPLWVVMEGNFGGEKKTIVNRTYWIPDQNRWCMLNEGQSGVLAWAHYTGLTKYDAPPALPKEVQK